MSNITELFLECMCERHSDQTKNLILHGNAVEKNKRNRISASDIGLINNFLEKNLNIVALQLCYNSIGDEGVGKLAEFFKESRSILYLDIRMNGIGAEGAKSLLDVGEELTIKSLNLAGNKIGKQGGIYISDLIRINDHLLHIDLAETDQTSTSIAHLFAALSEGPKLRNFNLSRVIGPPSYPFDSDHFTGLLLEILIINNSLRELHLQKNHLTGHDMELLCEGLSKNKSLEMLDLSCNSIGYHGATFLSKYLSSKPALKALDLSHNQIEDDGAINLGRGLPFSQLKYLDISFNRITDTGILSIFQNTPKEENKLLLFFLRGNDIKKQETLKMLQHLIDEKVINSETLDLIAYEAYGDSGQSVAHNHIVDTCKEDYYSVSKEKVISRRESIRGRRIRNLAHFVKSWPIPFSLRDEFGTPFLD